MPAITPNAPNHDNLDPLFSRFVRVGELPREKTKFRGVEVKTLLVDKASGFLTCLLRMAPGARLPDHEHDWETTWAKALAARDTVAAPASSERRNA
jgi:hypothetical protein